MQTQPTFDNANHYRRFQIIKQLKHTFERNWVTVYEAKRKANVCDPCLLHFLLPTLLFYYLLLEKLKWTKTNCYYFQHLHQLLFYILLGRYIYACQTNRRYFYKMNHLSRRKRADLFLVCYRSAETSAADLQIVYRSSTDFLWIVCRMSAEYLQNVCRNGLQFLQTFCRRRRYIVSTITDVLHQSNTFYFYRKYIKYSLKLRRKSLG